MSKNGAKVWMSTSQVADDMGCTVRVVYRAIDIGELTAYKFGRVIRIRRSDFNDYLESSKIGPGDVSHLA